MKIAKNIKAVIYGKVPIRVDVEHHGREGTKSPTMEIVLYNGKRYPPIAQRVYCIKCEYNLNDMFKLVYDLDRIKDLVRSENPFFKLISKDSTWRGSAYMPVPFEVKK
jgi:hypothetical protein